MKLLTKSDIKEYFNYRHKENIDNWVLTVVCKKFGYYFFEKIHGCKNTSGKIIWIKNYLNWSRRKKLEKLYKNG